VALLKQQLRVTNINAEADRQRMVGLLHYK
jgi:hypothetical protein